MGVMCRVGGGGGTGENRLAGLHVFALREGKYSE